MKTLLLLTTCLAFTALAPAAEKDDAKKDRKDRNEKKDDKKDADKDKEEMRNHFDVTVQGAKDATAEADVKTFLSSMEGVKVEQCGKTEKGMEAVLSTKTKISRGDVAKALKDNKDLKVSDFKAVRPGRAKDVKKPDEKKPV